jgi:peptide deformylase
MSEREIVRWPAPVLQTVAEPIAKVTPEIRALASDMFDTMYAANGLGLAANQVGVLQRLYVVDCGTEDTGPKPMVLINPELTPLTEEQYESTEGCLSIPGVYEKVPRFRKVRVTYRDLDFVERAVEAELERDGILTACLQHEFDHLNGTCFPAYLSMLKRQIILAKMRKLARGEPVEADARPADRPKRPRRPKPGEDPKDE